MTRHKGVTPSVALLVWLEHGVLSMEIENAQMGDEEPQCDWNVWRKGKLDVDARLLERVLEFEQHSPRGETCRGVMCTSRRSTTTRRIICTGGGERGRGVGYMLASAAERTLDSCEQR